MPSVRTLALPVAAALVVAMATPAVAATSADPSEVGDADGLILYVGNDLSRVEPDRTHRRQISSFNLPIAASLDGKWVVHQWADNLVRMSTRDPERRELIGHAETESGLGAFTADTSRFVFSRTVADRLGHAKRGDLWVWDRATREATLVAETDLVEEQPVWAEDENAVFFAAKGDRGCKEVDGSTVWSRDIYRMSLEDLSVQRLTDDPGLNWRIEDSVGDQLLVTARELRDPTGDPSEPCGKATPTMHTMAEAGEIVDDLGQGHAQALSPDGEHVLYRQYNETILMIMTIETGQRWWVSRSALTGDWTRKPRA